MAAVLTSNQPRDMLGIALGFPTNFSEAYSKLGKPYEWFGSTYRPAPPLQRGEGVQSDYHEQKRLDAEAMCLAGVRASRNSERHMLSFPSNYDLPKPVLGQRRYANPSLGSGSADIYAPVGRHVDWGVSMEGGVLRTAKGQRWGMDQLKKRVKELDAIDEGEASFTNYSAPAFANLKEAALVSQGLEEVGGPKLFLELAGLLSTISTAISSGNYSKLVLSDMFKFLKVLFRVGATANKDELNDVLSVISEALESIRGTTSDPRPPPHDKDLAALGALETLLTQAHEYLNLMIASVDKSPKERKVASRGAIKTLQFTRAITRNNASRYTTERDNKASLNLRILQQKKKTQKEYKKRAEAYITRVSDLLRAGGTDEEEALWTDRLTNALEELKRIEDKIDTLDVQIAEAKAVDKKRGKRSLPTIESEALDKAPGRRTYKKELEERRDREDADRMARAGLRGRGEELASVKPLRRVRLDADKRDAWAAKQGAYYREELPRDDGLIPQARDLKSAHLPTRLPRQADPIFDRLTR